VGKKTTRPSRFGGFLGSVLLLAVLIVLVLGVYGAVYLDEFRPAIQIAAIPSPPPPAKPAPPPRQAAVPVPPSAVAQVNPAASRSSPPGLAAKPGYWVEYGAYLGPHYAKLLVERLAALKIEAKITFAPGAGGLVYYRVRSFEAGTRDSAEADSHKAAMAIGIAPLVHRSGSAATTEAALASRDAPNSDLRYWVQFAAYNLKGYAERMVDKLHQSSLDATLIERRHPDGRPLYLVRSLPLKTREEALGIAARGQNLVGSPVLIGHNRITTGL
jgi:SPOR domain